MFLNCFKVVILDWIGFYVNLFFVCLCCFNFLYVIVIFLKVYIYILFIYS